jgi:hypothetical protein
MTFPWLTLCLVSLAFGEASEVNSEQAAAVAKIEAMGGSIALDPTTPSAPVTGVDLCGTKVTNAELEHLRAFPQLQELDLSDTAVTDAGLKHLVGLHKVRTLAISNNSVGDTGLAHLRGMTQLECQGCGIETSDEFGATPSIVARRNRSDRCGIPAP